MDQIWQEVSPLVSQLVVELIKIIALIVLAGFGLLQLKVKSAINTVENKNQREVLHKIANEAFAYAETSFSTESGRNKFNKAFIYTSDRLGKLGIEVTAEEINAAIEKAVLEYNAQKKVS
jgi:LL-H family phage holin